MAIKVGDNFNYQGQKPNFDRDSFDTLAYMKAYPETSIDDGHISYCKENGKSYQYKVNNSVDGTTGKWREFKSGDSYPAGGTDGQVLTKTSSGVAWEDIPEDEPELPSGGSNGQVLTKTASGTAWQDVPKEIPTGGTTGQVLKKTATGIEWGADNDTTYNKATQQADGLMSSTDKTKIDNLFNILNGGVDGQVLKKSGQSMDWGTDKDTTYVPATTTKNGLLSKEDKTKLDSIVAMTVLTQEEYDELATKDANTIYVIKG